MSVQLALDMPMQLALPPCRRDMAALFASLDPELMRTNTPEVIAQMMDMVRQHQVHLRSVVSTVVVSRAALCSAANFRGRPTQLD